MPDLPVTPRPVRCDHPYPDVLRLRDERKADGAFVRVLDCTKCGRYEIPLDIDDLEPILRLKLQFIGRDVAIREGAVERVRRKKRREADGALR